MSINEVRNTVMPLAVGTAINTAAMVGANETKRAALIEARQKAAEKYAELKHLEKLKGAKAKGFSAKKLNAARNNYIKTSKSLRATNGGKMAQFHTWLEKPYEFFAKGGKNLAKTAKNLGKTAADLGKKATTFKPGFWGSIQKFGTKTAEYAVKGSDKIVAGTGKFLGFLGKVPKTGIFAGALEAIFKAPELFQGLKEGRRADAVLSYGTKVGGTGASAVGGAKLGLMIGSKIGGFWGAALGTIAGIGVSMAGSWISDKGADLVFGKNKGTTGAGAGLTPPPPATPGTNTTTTTTAANGQPGQPNFAGNPFNVQNEWNDLAKMGLMGNANGLNGAMDFPPYNFNFYS